MSTNFYGVNTYSWICLLLKIPISMTKPCIICLFSIIYPLCQECSPKVTIKYDGVWDKSLKKTSRNENVK